MPQFDPAVQDRAATDCTVTCTECGTEAAPERVRADGCDYCEVSW